MQGNFISFWLFSFHFDQEYEWTCISLIINFQTFFPIRFTIFLKKNLFCKPMQTIMHYFKQDPSLWFSDTLGIHGKKPTLYNLQYMFNGQPCNHRRFDIFCIVQWETLYTVLNREQITIESTRLIGSAKLMDLNQGRNTWCK